MKESDYKPKYDIDKINAILKIENHDLVFDQKIAEKNWCKFFFIDLISEKGTAFSAIFQKGLLFLKETNHDEESFKAWFPELVYDVYYAPETMPNIPITISENKKQLIFNQLKDILKTSDENLYKIIRGCFSSRQQCDFFWLYCITACYDKELSIEMQSDSIMQDLLKKHNIKYAA